MTSQAGPLFIHPFFYVFGNQIYGAIFSALGFQMIPYEHSNLQKRVVICGLLRRLSTRLTSPSIRLSSSRVALGLVLFHFAKRELETIL